MNNVETLYNIALAEEDIPVTKKFICVAGAVKNPASFFVPIGTSFKDVIEFAGGNKVSEFGIFVGGVMMGHLSFDLNEVITKTTAGLIILPEDHYLIKEKTSLKKTGIASASQLVTNVVTAQNSVLDIYSATRLNHTKLCAPLDLQKQGRLCGIKWRIFVVPVDCVPFMLVRKIFIPKRLVTKLKLKCVKRE